MVTFLLLIPVIAIAFSAFICFHAARYQNMILMWVILTTVVGVTIYMYSTIPDGEGHSSFGRKIEVYYIWIPMSISAVISSFIGCIGRKETTLDKDNQDD